MDQKRDVRLCKQREKGKRVHGDVEIGAKRRQPSNLNRNRTKRERKNRPIEVASLFSRV